jgi:hypothetical protein
LSTKPDSALWLRLPEILTERKQLLCGVPFICAPVVKDDQVVGKSAPGQWTSEMAGAMLWAMKANLLAIKARETGQLTLPSEFLGVINTL